METLLQVKGENVLEPGVPESFKVLIKELQSLCLDVKVKSFDKTGTLREVEIKRPVGRAEGQRVSPWPATSSRRGTVARNLRISSSAW